MASEAEEHRGRFEEDPVGYGETYLAHISGKGDPNLIQAAYEKIVAQAATDENWWSMYCSWCEKELKVASVTVEVYKRAAESCPYVPWIWQGLLGSAERAQEEPQQIDSYWEKAKGTIADPESGLCLYRTYIYLLRRRISASPNPDYHPLAKIFTEGHQLLEEYFGRDWDPDGQYRRNHAQFLAERLGQVEEARKIWQDILATGGGRLAEKWLEAVRFERQFGDVQHARRLLYKALNSVADHPTVIFDYFVQFEREEGTLDELDAALDKINSQQHHRSQRPQKKVEEIKKKPEKGGKRKHEEKAGPKEKKPPRQEKNAPIGPTIPMQSAPAPMKDKDGFTVPLMSMVRRSPTPERAKAPPMRAVEPQTSEEPMEVDKQTKWTVFCSNIDFRVTAEDIQKALHGACDVRLAQRPGNKQHKGFAYVDFDTEKNMRQALAQDRQITLGQRQMFISINDPSNRATFKYAQGKEKNKVFVRNVHFDCTEEQLRDFFQQFGAIGAVRIVTHKSGKAKGVAYVDFVEEEAATRACEAEDLTLLDRKLIVAISDPPSRDSTSAPVVPPPADGSSRRSHIQIVPRSVTKKVESNGKPAPKGGLSNDEFRKKFLGK